MLCKTDYIFSVDLSSNASPHSPSIWSTYQELSIGSDQGALLQDLRGSEVFRGCAGFLDGKSTAERIIKAPLTVVLGIEEAAIMESNLLCPGAAVAARTNLPRIGELVEKIIRPLEQRKGIEAFHANLADARFGVLGGILRDIREVEVMLVSTGRVSDKPMPKLLNLILTSLSGVRNLPRSLRDFRIA